MAWSGTWITHRREEALGRDCLLFHQTHLLTEAASHRNAEVGASSNGPPAPQLSGIEAKAALQPAFASAGPVGQLERGEVNRVRVDRYWYPSRRPRERAVRP